MCSGCPARQAEPARLPAAWGSTAPVSSTWRLDGLLASRAQNGEASPTTFAYDAARRPTGSAKGSLLSFSQAYDRAGNVTAEGRSLAGIGGDAGTGTAAFAYDRLSRLVAESGLATARTYTYDLDGNRLTRVEGALTYTSTYDRADQLTTIIKTGGTSVAFAYDARGNLTGDAGNALDVTAYGYDLADRLTAITPAGGSTTTLALDALGRFASRTVPGSGTDTYSYLGSSEAVLRIANSLGTTTDAALDVAGARLGVRVSSVVNWFVPDLHGNVAAALDGTATTTRNALRYDAYGQVVATGGPGGVGGRLLEVSGQARRLPDNGLPV